MRRFAIFVTVLLVLVVVGFQPRAAGSQKESVCVCVASKAALIMKSISTMTATAKTQAPSQPHLTETASAAQ